MRFKPLTDLYMLVAAAAPGLNETSAIDELRRAARELCRETLVSQETIETSIAIGDRSVALESPSASLVYVTRALFVTTPRGPLKVVTLDELNTDEPAWRTATGAATCCAQETNDELVLNREATTAESPWYVRVACVPTLTAARIDALLVDEYAEIIGAGALSRILRMPNQTWTDTAEATRNESMFQTEISRIRGAANVNRSAARLPVRIRRQA